MSLLFVCHEFNPWFPNANIQENLNALLSLCKSLNVNCKIIVYLRRQDYFAESMFIEEARSSNRYKCIKDFLHIYNEFLDYFSMLKGMQNIFGNNLIVRNYDCLIDNDICKDFLKVINADIKFKNIIRINNKFELNALYIQQILNDTCRGTNKINQEILTNGFHKFNNYSLMSKDEAKQILEECKESNNLLYEKYNIKFSDDLSKYEKKYTSNNEYMINDLIVYVNNTRAWLEKEFNRAIYENKTSTKIKKFLKKFVLVRFILKLKKKH